MRNNKLAGSRMCRTWWQLILRCMRLSPSTSEQIQARRRADDGSEAMFRQAVAVILHTHTHAKIYLLVLSQSMDLFPVGSKVSTK